VQGCLAWQQSGLNTPQAVQSATENYRAEMDTVGGFIDDCCVLRPDARTLGTPLYKAYKEWCEANCERPMSQRDFSRRLDARGLISRRTTKGFWRQGIGLLVADQQGFNDPDDDPMIPDDPRSDMNGASENLMGHVENRIISDHRIIPDLPDTSVADRRYDPMIPDDPRSDMNGASENLMGHVENRIISDHRIIPDLLDTAAASPEALDMSAEPLALPGAPDSVAEVELTDGSVVWLVLDAGDTELSRHTTKVAALAWAHSNEEARSS
jgi:hypothetical protein